MYLHLIQKSYYVVQADMIFPYHNLHYSPDFPSLQALGLKMCPTTSVTRTFSWALWARKPNQNELKGNRRRK